MICMLLHDRLTILSGRNAAETRIRAAARMKKWSCDVQIRYSSQIDGIFLPIAEPPESWALACISWFLLTGSLMFPLFGLFFLIASSCSLNLRVEKRTLNVLWYQWPHLKVLHQHDVRPPCMNGNRELVIHAGSNRDRYIHNVAHSSDRRNLRLSNPGRYRDRRAAMRSVTK